MEPTRRSSIKDRYQHNLEEQKKNDIEKVSSIKEKRQLTSTSSFGTDLKGKWEDTVATSKAEEEKKYLARRATTMASFQETEGNHVIL
jgi:hypothetical protein